MEDLPDGALGVHGRSARHLEVAAGAFGFKGMNMSIGPLVSLIAGILILIVPRLLNYIVAIYLIIIGLLGLFGPLHF
jgi:hypothetical protein